MTVKQLRELLARATKGPWRQRPHDANAIEHKGDPYYLALASYAHGDDDGRSNAALIVALRNSADAMLDVVEAAQAYAKIMDNNEGYLCEEELALRDALAKLEGAG